MKLEMVKGGIWKNYIDLEDTKEMSDFVHEDVVYALEETSKFNEEEISSIVDILFDDEDWDKAISIMQSCGFAFKVVIPFTSLDELKQAVSHD